MTAELHTITPEPGPVHSGPMGRIDELLNAWDAALAASLPEGAAYDGRLANRTRQALRLACVDVVGINNTVGLACNHRSVMALVHATQVWSDLIGTPPDERRAAGEAAQILAASIRASRARVFRGES